MKKETEKFTSRLGDAGFAMAFGQCIGCKHYDAENDVCPAFPDIVPQDIYDKIIKHNVILPNQVGETIFEPEED